MSTNYFEGLNYTLGNEDTTLEVEIVKKTNPKKILAICGSGGRSLPLMSKDTELLTILDLSFEQLFIAQLRLATYKQLNYEQFLLFWGYSNLHLGEVLERKELFLKLNLDNQVKRYFSHIFEKINFSSLLYLGKWEKTFQTLAKVNRIILGSDFDHIFSFNNLEQQRIYYRDQFPLFRWKLVLFLLGNRTLFNALLYKGDFIEKNYSQTHYRYYFNAFENLFLNNIAKESFFLQLCFFGMIKNEAGYPIEARSIIHKTIAASKTHIEFVSEDFISFLSKGLVQYDFLSLSDVPSYFKGNLETNFMQMIKPGLNPGAIIVNRYYLRKPDCNLDDFIDISSEFHELIKIEKVQMYDIKIYQFDPKIND